MKPAPVVGIAGRARVGKDTLTDFLLAQYGGYRHSFAAPLKSMLKAGFNLDFDDPYWVDRKETVIPALGRSPRELMQTLGTEWGRMLVHPDVWLILATGTLHNRGPGMIVSDLRFENEAAWVRRMGGVVIHLQREAAPQVKDHKSEAGIAVQPVDLQVFNNGSLEDLQFATSRIFSP